MLAPLLLACVLSASEAPVAPVSAPAVAPNYEADTPPPSKYDLEHRNAPFVGEGRTLVNQLVRTILALGVVIGLIYLVVKLLLPRLVRGSLSTAGQMRVLERTQLGPRHVLYLVELGNGTRLVVGASEQNLQLLANLQAPNPSFSAAMEAHGATPSRAESRDAQTN